MAFSWASLLAAPSPRLERASSLLVGSYSKHLISIKYTTIYHLISEQE